MHKRRIVYAHARESGGKLLPCGPGWDSVEDAHALEGDHGSVIVRMETTTTMTPVSAWDGIKWNMRSQNQATA
jgi:hypothetical protein